MKLSFVALLCALVTVSCRGVEPNFANQSYSLVTINNAPPPFRQTRQPGDSGSTQEYRLAFDSLFFGTTEHGIGDSLVYRLYEIDFVIVRPGRPDTLYGFYSAGLSGVWTLAGDQLTIRWTPWAPAEALQLLQPPFTPAETYLLVSSTQLQRDATLESSRCSGCGNPGLVPFRYQRFR